MCYIVRTKDINFRYLGLMTLALSDMDITVSGYPCRGGCRCIDLKRFVSCGCLALYHMKGREIMSDYIPDWLKDIFLTVLVLLAITGLIKYLTGWW